MKAIRWDLSLIAGIVLTILAALMSVTIPLFLKTMIDGGGHFSLKNIFILLLLFVLQAALAGLGGFLAALNGEKTVESLRSRLNAHLIYLPQSFFDQQESGEFVSRIMTDSQEIREFVTQSLPNFILGIFTIIFSVIALIRLDWKLSLAMVITFPVMLSLLIPISKLSFANAEKFQTSNSRLTSKLITIYKNMAFIKLLTAEDQVSNDFDQANQENFSLAVQKKKIEAFTQPVGLAFLFAAITIVFAYGGYRVSSGAITVGTLMSFLVFTLQLLNPMGGLSDQISSYFRMKGASAKLFSFFEMAKEDVGGDQVFQAGDILIKDVSFAYQDKEIITGLDLVIPRGCRLAIVGPSGSGKSTLTRLLMRLYQPQKGQISINGQEINRIDLYQWRNAISYIAQGSFFISGSLRDNLLFGLKSKPTDQKIHQVLQQVGLSEDLARMEQGLDTPVGEDGNLLSGGQKQRLSIARALLREHSIIIFDEATSNLDADKESVIIQLIKDLPESITVIIVAHRLSTVVDADEIIFFDQGRITGLGSHRALYANHEDYRRYVNEQMIQ
ncbi:hypothetical protein HMPREF2758_02080 [Facklamia sp. HMSC062C11]|uniref:ABC transporter ATP-binding protein n=1 Tax=Facklamia sp. HMSC062C11 TaxID=1739262 RepID=UPI0008A64947|nr:ABC transporter ATP-binding protein [Facklamia sp. HMSC062C11]OFL65636.1 hypothetical protein HMPREF2758_02080 [Facklamia sp. HMSC062C11]